MNAIQEAKLAKIQEWPDIRFKPQVMGCTACDYDELYSDRANYDGRLCPCCHNGYFMNYGVTRAQYMESLNNREVDETELDGETRKMLRLIDEVQDEIDHRRRTELVVIRPLKRPAVKL